MKKLILIALTSLCCLASGTALARSEPLVNYDNVQVSSASGKVLTAEDMKAIFLRAGARGGWEFKDIGAGKLAASLAMGRGKHVMIIAIAYTGGSYAISYRDSYELNYAQEGGRQVIHPNYNKAVAKLIDMVRLEAQMY